jgi:RHS repeat-associated protein
MSASTPPGVPESLHLRKGRNLTTDFTDLHRWRLENPAKAPPFINWFRGEWSENLPSEFLVICVYRSDLWLKIFLSRRFFTKCSGTPAIQTATAALSVTKLAVILKDHLGSTDVLLTGTWNGSNWGSPTIQRESFDTWGERRVPETQVAYRQSDGDAFRTGPDTYERGYTGHEQLDDSGLIHMNGRLYDPELGRMLSPDPYVQVPEYSQNFNRYSYVLNNPLNLTDPTGFSWFGKAMGWLKTNWRTVVVIVVAAILVCTGIGSAIGGAMFASLYGVTGAVLTPAMYMAGVTAMTGAFVGAVTGALGAALAGGNLGDVLRGAVVGGISGALTGALHGTSTMVNIAGHGVVGGSSNVAMGGKFGDGFLSAAASAAAAQTGFASPEAGTTGAEIGIAGRTAIASIAGGTASALGGGKFANGAITGAMTHLLNAEALTVVEKMQTVHVQEKEASCVCASIKNLLGTSINS